MHKGNTQDVSLKSKLWAMNHDSFSSLIWVILYPKFPKSKLCSDVRNQDSYQGWGEFKCYRGDSGVPGMLFHDASMSVLMQWKHIPYDLGTFLHVCGSWAKKTPSKCPKFKDNYVPSKELSLFSTQEPQKNVSNFHKTESLPSLSVKTWFLNFSHLLKCFSSWLPTSFPSLAIAWVEYNLIFYWWFGVISKTYCPITTKQERYLPLIQVGPDNYVFVFSSPWV